MAFRIVGGYTCALGDSSRILSRWGIIDAAELQNTSPRNGQHVKLAEGYSVDDSEACVYAECFLVCDDYAEEAWAIIGVETHQLDNSEDRVQELNRWVGVRAASDRQLVFLDAGRSPHWSSVQLILRRACGHDRECHIEVLSTTAGGDAPCDLVSSHGVRSWPGMFLGRFKTHGKRHQHVHSILTMALDAVPVDVESTSVCQGRIYAAAAVGGVALGVAAPFAVMGVVSALGFGSGGVVAGSTAAGMMSAEAAAAGGGVAAGGVVATLQSIGAAGLGAVGTAGSASAGAFVGTAVGGTAGSLTNRRNSGDIEDASGRWTVVTEEWFAKSCSTYLFCSASSARAFFDRKWRCARIMVNPCGQEVMSGIFISDANSALSRVRTCWHQQLQVG